MADPTRPYVPGEEQVGPSGDPGGPTAAPRAATSEPGGSGPPGQAGYWPDPRDCPVTPLGHREDVYFFFNRARELVKFGHRDLGSPTGLRSLFGGDVSWLRAAPAFAGEKHGSIAWGVAGGWLMRVCNDRGLWDPVTAVRGPGVWRADGGGVVVHAGDGVWIDGAWRAAGQRLGGALYPAAPPRARPAATPATAAEGVAILEACRLWRYEDAIGPELVCGMIGAAALGGAPFHRAHMLISGRYGTGKSWLMDLIAAALGAGAQPLGNDVTPASLYQAFTGEARALILDESEDDSRDAGRVGKVIELLRRMATGSGAEVRRGSAAGKHVAYHVTGSAVLAATLAPAMKPPDRSRITQVRLAPLPAHKEAAGGAELALAAIARAAASSAALRARAIAGWPRFLDTFGVYRARFLETGLAPRDANQGATLMAGRDLLIADEVPIADTVIDEVQRFAPLVNWAAENAGEGEGQQALVQLVTYPVDLWRGGDRLTVADLIWRAYFDSAEAGMYRKRLPALGLRAEGGRRPGMTAAAAPPRELWIANDNVFLRKVYGGTRWEGRWKEGLRDLDGARGCAAPKKYQGVNQRFTIIPEAYLPAEDDPEFAAGAGRLDDGLEDGDVPLA